MGESMESPKLCFLSMNHDVSDSDRRARDLEKSKALSHAARAGHRKKYSKRDKEQNPSVPCTTPNIRSVTTGSLDPFVRLSMHLTMEDRDLLHGYLVTVPQEFYGTCAASSFCPVRDVTLGVLSMNQILLSWAVLFMQHRKAIFQNISPYQDPLVLRRRRQTYKIMSLQIRDQQSAISEDAMYGLAFSALLEHRIGDKPTAQKHLQACLTTKQLRVQKGLTVLSYPMGTLCIPVCMQVGVTRYFNSLEDVTRAGMILKELLWSLQECKSGSSGSSSDGCSAKSNQCLWTRPALHQPDSTQRQKAILRYHLSRSLQETSVTGNRLCLALLITLSLVTRTLHHDGNGAAEFLQLISHCFGESGSAFNPGKAPLTMLGLLYTTFMCLDQVQSSISHRECEIDVWPTVDMVEFLMFATPSSIVRVKQDLISWILDDTEDPVASQACDHIFQEHIIEDVEVAWLARQPHVAQTSHENLQFRYLPPSVQSGITPTSTELAKAFLKRAITPVSNSPV